MMYNSEHLDPRQIHVFRKILLAGLEDHWDVVTLLAYAQAMEQTSVDVRQQAALKALEEGHSSHSGKPTSQDSNEEIQRLWQSEGDTIPSDQDSGSH